MATERAPWERPGLSEKERADIGQSGASAAASSASAGRTTALTPEDVRLRKAQATALEEKNRQNKIAREAAQRASKVKAGMTQEDVNNVLGKIAEARRLVSGWSTGWGSYLAGLPETEARSLKGLLGPEGTISSQVLLRTMEKMRASSASGATGLGAMDKNENKTLKNSITNLDLGRKREEVLRSLNDLDRGFRRYAAITSGYDPDERDTAIQFGLIPREDKKAEGPPPNIGGVTAEENVSRPENLRGLNATVSKMLREGRSADDIKTYLNTVEAGLGDRTLNLDWWETEMRKPEGKRARPEDYVNVEEVRTQASAPEKAIGEFAQTPVGTALLGATDFATLGVLPQFTGDPEATRAAIKGAEIANPGAFLTGQVLGGITGGMGIEALAAKYGTKLSPATIAALQGGGYGYSASEEQGLSAVPEALLSAGLGYVGGRAGEAVGNVVGKAATGIKDEAVTAMRQRGIPLTIGEMLGPRASAIEARLANMPVIGPAITARLEEGTEAFNRAAFKEGLQNLSEKYKDYGPKVGATGFRKARGNVSQAFKDALGGVTLTQDGVFQRNISNAWTELGELPDVGPKLLKALNDQLGDLLKPGRELTGVEVQAALRKVDRIGRNFRSSEIYESSIAPRLNAVEDEIRGVVERQAPDVLPQYDVARDAWRKVSVVGEAVRRATRGESAPSRGVFSPEELQAAGMANAEKFTGKGSSITRGYPFQELAESGIDVLTPRGRSGFSYTLPITTAGLVGGASYLAQPGQETNPITGATSGEERDPVTAAMLGLGAAGLTALPYSRAGQGLLNRLLLSERSPNAETISSLVDKYAAGVGAGTGAATLGGALLRGTPDVTEYPEISFQPIEVKPLNAEEVPVAAPGQAGLNTMPSTGDVQFDAETNEVVMPDGTRIPLSSLAEPQ